RYVPDAVDGTALAIDPVVSRKVAAIARDIRSLNGAGTEGLAGISLLSLRLLGHVDGRVTPECDVDSTQ
ncbi:MAG: hypothetical protein RI958_3336, partial [Actinomycetota bacterium]